MMAKLDPQEPIPGVGGKTLIDFWTWAYSDLLSNTTRPLFAEFIVGVALDALNNQRLEWDAVDLWYRGKAIEVKSAAYLQTWAQKAPSVIRWDIGMKLAWDAKTNASLAEAARTTDCYVLCVYTHTERETANVLDVDAWQFYVLSAKEIGERFGKQKSIGLRAIQAISSPVGYDALRRQVDNVLDSL